MKNSQKVFKLILLLIIAVLLIVVSYALSSSKAKTSPITTAQTSQTFNTGINLSVPPLYPKYKWNLASVPFYEFNPGSPFSMGKTYETKNTDSQAVAWQAYVKNSSSDEGAIAFYSGDQELLDYYDAELTSSGYSNRLLLDQNLIPTNDEYDPHTHIMMAPSADGPEGTIKGYIKYDQRKVRIVLISSDVDKNEVFVSDIVNVKDAIPF